MDFRKMSHEER